MNVWGTTKKILSIGLLCLPLTMTTTLTGCLTDEDKDSTPVVTPEPTAVKTGTLGAQSNATLGSFLELDAWTILKLSEVTTANAANVDLVFAYSTSQSAAAFYSPKAAADGIGGSAGFDFVKTALGASARTTEMKSISAAAYTAITTKAGLDSAWTAGTAVADGRLALTEGVTFIAMSSANLPVAIKITSLTASAAGSVAVEGKAKW